MALLLGSLIAAYLLPRVSAQNEAASPQRRTTLDKRPEFVPGELLVRFRDGTSLARNKSSVSVNVANAGRSVHVEVNHFGGSDLVQGLMLARMAPDDMPAALKALRARADVVYAEPNYIRYPDAVPNDPRYVSQYGLKDPNQSAGGISAESAWNTTTGNQNVVVGVIDSGIDITHVDLKDNIFVNTGEVPGNNIDDDNNGFIDDVNGWDFANNDRTVFDSVAEDLHGTHVAGTIGARGNNGIGVAGVSWNVQLMPLKALGNGTAGSPDSRLIEAYKYAKTMRQRGVNLRVLNNSYGGQFFSESLLNAVRELNDAGILFVASAGNDTLNNDWVSHYPSSFDSPNVIAVAASNESGFLATQFTNFGRKSVHLAAPGVNILSTAPHGYTGEGLAPGFTEPDGSTYAVFSGTSMAAPHVSGTAALACAANPGISLGKLKASLLGGADETGAFFSTVITRGRLNANKTLQFALENDSTAPAAPENYEILSQEGRRLQVRWADSGDDGMTGQATLREFFFTDAVSNEKFLLAIDRPSLVGTIGFTFLSIPFKHTTGQLTLRFTDNAGNTSTASRNVSVPADAADPYIVTTGAAAALTAPNSGTLVGQRGDDITSLVGLPFPFPFFGDSPRTAVFLSTNGAMYLPNGEDSGVPNPNFGPFDFAVATERNLDNLSMIAGMWSDLRTDRNATDGIYMVQPDIDRVIFRWQAVTFGTDAPVNFEIELRRDGTIQTRYGSGNVNLAPLIVGVSGGDPETYLVPTHSAPNGPPLNLTNAQSVTFALRNPPPPPVADLAISVTGDPNPVIAGKNITYMVSVSNLGPSTADLVVMTDVLPAGTSFVSCNSSHFAATCTNSGSTVTGRMNTLERVQFDSGVRFTIVAKVDAAPGTALQNNPSVSGFRPDPNPANNSATVTNHVVAESFFANARAIAAGNAHSTSVKTDGTVWTWGGGSLGQLGDGSRGIGVHAPAPVQVADLAGVEKVEDGNGFVYALKSDRTVWAWGLNNQAQLGDGTMVDRTRPVQTTGLTNVIGIAAGDFFGAALKADGTVWVWGADGVFTGRFSEADKTPVQITGINNVTAIAAGDNHLVMLKSDKTVWAAGRNSMGQLGDGTSTPSQTPVQVTGVSNVARIAAGEEFTLARKEDGTIWAWGVNFNGVLGPGGGAMDFGPHPNPVQVTGLPSITEIAAGRSFCLAVAGDGTVWSWGNNNSFQLGQGQQISQNPTPKQIPNFGNVVSVAGGSNHSVALKSDGSVWTWGSNDQGALGDASLENRFSPVRVTGLQAVSVPLFNPEGGVFQLAVDVTVSCPTPGATIHYTVNGNDPTESDPIVASGGTVRLTTNSTLRARAWKPGLIPSVVTSMFFEVRLPPPQLVVEENGPVTNQLAAVDLILMLRGPFSKIEPMNWARKPNDPNTRIVFFALNLQPPTSLFIVLTPANGGFPFFLSSEDVRAVPGTNLSQVTLRLPNEITPGTWHMQVSANGGTSNSASIQIKP